MFTLFGRRTTQRSLGEVAYLCPRCRRNAWHHYRRSTSWLSVFFIPCIPLGTRTVAHCTLCNGEELVDNAGADSMIARQTRRAAVRAREHA